MPPFRTMLVCVFLALGTQAYASEFTIDDWDAVVSVITTGAGSDGRLFDDVVNPFSGSHQVELGASSASASYDFAWGAEGGHFSIESQIAAELVSNGSNRASSHGWIRITPSVDLAFHIDATMDFNLPRHLMIARLEPKVTKYDPYETLYWGYRNHDTLLDGIGSGTLSLSDDFILPAGQQYNLQYDMYVYTYPYYPGGEGSIGTATASVNFSFTVLPEPNTLALLSLSALLLLRRSRT